MKIYSAYAYKDNEKEAREHNQKVYDLLKENNKVKFKKLSSSRITDSFEILENPDNLTDEELALFVSRNGLHFGYYVIKGENIIKIYTD